MTVGRPPTSLRQTMRRFRMVARQLLVVLSVGLSWALLAASVARADADPASDILLGSPAFYPFQPSVSSALQHQLEATLAQLRAKGLNLKVAIIESPVDLGAIPNMFGKPQTYADFLEREISFNSPVPLLVVMPTGFGVSHAGPISALSGLSVDAAQQSNGLARAAILAVVRIARAEDKPVTAGPLASATGGSGGGTSPLLTFGGPAVLVLLAAAGAGLVRRRAAAVDAAKPARGAEDAER
jgi:hypothetical protein